ncbi:MAG: lytic transglycosylase domain-containing protein [Gammaproteobacteria bacterium]|nr:lytic transglycosylase domain-containing protein [Gammaproteobacteria bacterium]
MSANSSWLGCRPRLRPSTAALGLLLALLLAGRAVAAEQAPPSAELRERVRDALVAAGSFNDRFDAQVWLTDMAGRLGRQVPDEQTRLRILTTAHQEATRVGLPPEMVLAVIDVESAFNPYAVSSAGAQGLMQVMPFWREELGRRRLVDIEDNLLMGCTILRYYYDMEKGNWTRALARYNGSLGRTEYPNKVFDRLRRRWFQH